jgi:hypothetical protein
MTARLPTSVGSLVTTPDSQRNVATTGPRRLVPTPTLGRAALRRRPQRALRTRRTSPFTTRYCPVSISVIPEVW